MTAPANDTRPVYHCDLDTLDLHYTGAYGEFIGTVWAHPVGADASDPDLAVELSVRVDAERHGLTLDCWDADDRAAHVGNKGDLADAAWERVEAWREDAADRDAGERGEAMAMERWS